MFRTVLTGNRPDVARVTLDAFGLADYLNPDEGAYGAYDTGRSALVHIAQERASVKSGVPVLGDVTIILVGDTPGNMAGDKGNRAADIGAATGKTAAD